MSIYRSDLIYKLIGDVHMVRFNLGGWSLPDFARHQQAAKQYGDAATLYQMAVRYGMSLFLLYELKCSCSSENPSYVQAVTALKLAEEATTKEPVRVLAGCIICVLCDVHRPAGCKQRRGRRC